MSDGKLPDSCHNSTGIQYVVKTHKNDKKQKEQVTFVCIKSYFAKKNIYSYWRIKLGVVHVCVRVCVYMHIVTSCS